MPCIHTQNLRWLLLGLIIVVIGAVGFDYMHTALNRAASTKDLPKVLDAGFIRSAERVEYSEFENGVMQFTLRAAKLLETSQGKSLFERIEAFDSDPNGSTFNRFSSPKAEYYRDEKKVVFSDGVHIQMSRGIEIRTRSLQLDLQTRIWETDDRFEIGFHQIHGSARGLRFEQDKEQLVFKADIDFLLEQRAGSPATGRQDASTRVQSQKGYYSQARRVLCFMGNARIDSSSETLRGDEIEGKLSEDEIRISSLFCKGNAAWVPKNRQVEAGRSVKWVSANSEGNEDPVHTSARTITADSLQISYPKGGDYLESGRAAGNVVLTGIPMARAGSMAIRRIKAATVRFEFYPDSNRMRSLDGEGHVLIAIVEPPDPSNGSIGREAMTSSSHMRLMFRQSDGAMEALTQRGRFIYQDGERTATSGSGDYSSAKDVLRLRESPRISDANGITTGDLLSYDPKEQTLVAQGHVRSIIGSKNNSGVIPFFIDLGSSRASFQPVIVTSEAVQCWSKTGTILYSGNVRLSYEGGHLTAQSLEILDSGRRIGAEGDIRHLLRKSDPTPGRALDWQKMAPAAIVQQADGTSGGAIQIQSAAMQFDRSGNNALYFGNVQLRSNNLAISSESMDVIFESRRHNIDRIIARGTVHIRQGSREVKGLASDYSLASGELIVTGDLAEIQDPQRGRLIARKITLYLSDDRIHLDDR